MTPHSHRNHLRLGERVVQPSSPDSRPQTSSSLRHPAAFTLVELLVTMAVLAVMLTMVADIIARTQNVISRARERTESFQEARAAFDVLTSTLSQATMNANWGYHMGSNVNNSYFKRESDQHFVLGPNSELLTGNTETSQAVFFQAPLGFAGNLAGGTGTTSDQLNHASEILNCWGYYITYGSDLDQRPAFLNTTDARTLNPERKRFRLMEFRLPAEQSRLYSMNITEASNAQSHQWYLGPFQDGSTIADHSTPIAENVLAMILVPHSITHTSQLVGDTNTQFTPETDYRYDSRLFQWQPADAKAKRTRHQLPAMVQVTLIVSDEASYERYENQFSSPETAAADIRSIFTGKFTNHSQYTSDMESVVSELNQRKLNYKVFSSAVAMRGAKWITDYEL